MFIVGDESKSNGKIPWVTFSLIALNIVVFCAQRFLGDAFTRGFSLVPKEISTLTDLTKPEHVRAKVPDRIWYENGKRKTHFREVTITVPQAPGPFPIFLTLLTSMFLHGDWLHLIGNLWFLAVFGRNVECALDHGRFLAFYLACGVLGGLAYTVSDVSSVIPCLGASGAISGVMGAYVAIHPFNPVSLWVGCYVGVIQLPAIAVVGAWFLFQYLAAFQSLEYAGTNLGGTAYWEHVGGFLAGAGIIWGTVGYLKLRSGRRPPEEEVDEDELADQPEAPEGLAIAERHRAFPSSSTNIEDIVKPEYRDEAAAPDPFLTCLPPSTAVQSMEKKESSTAVKAAHDH
jgi:membrane associated rhomboid family serine protease